MQVAWRDRAACRGMIGLHHEQAWDVERQCRTNDFEVARAVCLACPVRTACTDYALTLRADEIEGVFGGADPIQLRRAIADGSPGARAKLFCVVETPGA